MRGPEIPAARRGDPDAALPCKPPCRVTYEGGVRSIHILHVIPLLGRAGTELALARVVRGLAGPRFEHSIACLTGEPAIAGEFTTAPIHCMYGERAPFRSLLRLRQLITNTRPSVIHARNLSAWADVAAVGLTLRHRPPLVLSFHGSDTTDPIRPRKRLMAALAGRTATRVFAVSEPAREFVVRSLHLPRHRIAVIPNGVDTRRYVPRGRESHARQPIVVGTVGNLNRVKNQAVLVRACAELYAGGIPLELKIAGEGPERPRLEQLAASLGIARLVELRGHVADVPAFLQALDLFVFPSDSEGHPNALLEAMACGLPCVASRVGGIPDVLNDDCVGRLFERADVGGLVTAMREVIASADVRAAMSRAARKRIEEHYDVDDMIRRYAALYEGCAD